MARLREERYPLPPTPSNDEERKDFIKRVIDENREHLFNYVPPDTTKYGVEPRHQLTFPPFERLKAVYLKEVDYKKVTDTPLLYEYTANELNKVEYELALLDEPLSEMLYNVFLSDEYKDGRIHLDNGLLARFGVQNTILGADDGLLPARIARIWDRVLYKLYLQGEQNRLNKPSTKRQKKETTCRLICSMTLEQVTKLYDELIKAGKFIDVSTNKQAFVDNLTTDNAAPITWVGGNGQLAYLVEKLISKGLIEAQRGWHWVATKHHFIGLDSKRFDNLVRDKQRYDMNKKEPMPKRGDVINAIIKEVKAVVKAS